MKTTTSLIFLSAVVGTVLAQLSPMESLNMAIQKSLMSPFGKKFSLSPSGFSPLLGKGPEDKEKPLTLPGLQGFSCLNQPNEAPAKSEFVEMSSMPAGPATYYNFPQNFNLQGMQMPASASPQQPQQVSIFQTSPNQLSQKINIPPEYQTTDMSQFNNLKQMSLTDLIAISNFAKDLPDAAASAMKTSTLPNGYMSQMNKFEQDAKKAQPSSDSFNLSGDKFQKPNIQHFSFPEFPKKNGIGSLANKFNSYQQYQQALPSGSAPSLQNFNFQ